MNSFLFFIVAFCPLVVDLFAEEAAKRIQAHITISNYRGAKKEAEEALQNPNTCSEEVLKVAIIAYAKSHEDTKAHQLYSRWEKEYGTPSAKKALIEAIAWGVIEKQSLSGSPFLRAISLLACSLQQDMRSVLIIERMVEDPHREVRKLAITVATQFSDEKVKAKLLRRFPLEEERGCRIALISCIGSWKIDRHKELFYRVISSSKSSMEEKVAAIEALIKLEAPLPLPELQGQLSGSRAARKMVARYIARRKLTSARTLLEKLLTDEFSEVRGEAIVAYARLFPEERSGLVFYEKEPYFSVKLAVLFSRILNQDPEAEAVLYDLLLNSTSREREEIAAMVGFAGAYGAVLADRLLQQPSSIDPYVMLNLSLAAESALSSDTLFAATVESSDPLMTEEGVLFPFITKSTLELEPAMINYPDLVDKEIRLELIWRLHLKGDTRALEAMRSFLKKQGWGIPIIASLLLTSEGSSYDEEFVRDLLQDPSKEIRLQAALFFSLRDQDESMFSYLAEAYPFAGRDKQEVILNAMGKIPTEEAEAFLIRELGGPLPSIRLLAAMWILSRYYG